MATVKGPEGYSVDHRHEYSTLKTPFGNYTRSYSGDKLSGQLCTIKSKLLDRLDTYMKEYMRKNKDSKFGEALENLMNNFETVVPEVKDLKTNDVKPGDVVTLDTGFKAKYPGEYVVQECKNKNAILEVDGHRIGFPKYALVPTGKTAEYEKPWSAIPLKLSDSIRLISHPELGVLSVIKYTKTRASVKDSVGKGYNFNPSNTKYEIVK